MSGPTDQLVQRILAAFADEGDGRAARLLVEARAEAETEVKAILKSAMKAALLQHAAAQLDRLEPSPQPPEVRRAEPREAEPRRADPRRAEPRDEESVANVELACYVYAIARDAPDESRLPPG